jgi:transposase
LLFVQEIISIAPENLIYLDESGVDNKQYRRFSRSKRGSRAFGDVRGGGKERYSIIAALNQKQVRAPFVFKGNTNTLIFNNWLKTYLAPELTPGQTIIMDNATFHTSAATKQIIESAGCKLLYLPPYSPDLNPIEQYWAITKNRLKSGNFKYKKLISNIHAALKCNVRILD